MQGKDSFSGFHPAINFIFFALVLVCSMCLMHPVCLLISLGSAVAYAAVLNGGKALRRSLKWVLPMLLLAVVINPALNHQGVTILCYLPSGKPLTQESVLFGAAAAAMLLSVLAWFSCYNAVVSSDKFLYLFGHVIPALSLLLSMALRFVPQFIRQLRIVREAQKCIGRGTSDGTALQRLRNGVTIFSVLVTWSLENAIETADSMTARGYGLPGRSAFSVYRFDGRDRLALIWLTVCGAYIIAGWIAGGFYFNYYPMVTAAPVTPFTLTFPMAYLALSLTPVILDRREASAWKHSASQR